MAKVSGKKANANKGECWDVVIEPVLAISAASLRVCKVDNRAGRVELRAQSRERSLHKPSAVPNQFKKLVIYKYKLDYT